MCRTHRCCWLYATFKTFQIVLLSSQKNTKYLYQSCKQFHSVRNNLLYKTLLNFNFQSFRKSVTRKDRRQRLTISRFTFEIGHVSKCRQSNNRGSYWVLREYQYCKNQRVTGECCGRSALAFEGCQKIRTRCARHAVDGIRQIFNCINLQ